MSAAATCRTSFSGRGWAPRLCDHRAGHDLADHRGQTEDLRIFLEEAAGISKYRNDAAKPSTGSRHAGEPRPGRRHRVELGAQIEKLEKQAEVARRYNELNAGAPAEAGLAVALAPERGAERGAAPRARRRADRHRTRAETARLRETRASSRRRASSISRRRCAQRGTSCALWRQHRSVRPGGGDPARVGDAPARRIAIVPVACAARRRARGRNPNSARPLACGRRAPCRPGSAQLKRRCSPLTKAYVYRSRTGLPRRAVAPGRTA